MSLATIVKAMTAAGCTAEQICAAVEAYEADQEKKCAERRAKDAERKRQKRAGVSVVSAGHDGCPQDGADKKKVSPTPPSKKNISPPSPPTGGIPPTKNRGATLCPTDWRPKSETVEALQSEGYPNLVIERARLEMIDWSQSGGKRKHDWDATHRNWVRRDAKPRNNSPPDKQSKRQQDIERSRAGIL